MLVPHRSTEPARPRYRQVHPAHRLIFTQVAVKLQLAQASQLEEGLASVRAQLAEARAGHDYIKPVEKAPKKKFFGRSKK